MKQTFEGWMVFFPSGLPCIPSYTRSSEASPEFTANESWRGAQRVLGEQTWRLKMQKYTCKPVTVTVEVKE